MGIIYKATNKINGKIYIGQSINPLEKRIGQHFAEARTFIHGDRFKKALRKYGEDGFNWVVIYKTNNDYLNEAEDYFINLWNTTDRNIGYNVLTSHSSYRRTDELKRKLSKKIKNQYKKERKAWIEGKTHSEQTRKKISENHADFSGKNNPMYGKSAWKDKKHSEETKQKMREAAIKRNRDRKGKFI